MRYLYAILGILGITRMLWYLQRPEADSNFLVTSVVMLFCLLVMAYTFKPEKINHLSNVTLVLLITPLLPLPFDPMYIVIPCALVLIANFLFKRNSSD